MINSLPDFILGVFFSYIFGILVSFINLLTEKAHLVRFKRKKAEKEDLNNGYNS